MKVGDVVKVYPHGSPEQAALGTVEIISNNERAIIVAFDDKPSFAKVHHDGLVVLRDGGKLPFMAT